MAAEQMTQRATPLRPEDLRPLVNHIGWPEYDHAVLAVNGILRQTEDGRWVAESLLGGKPRVRELVAQAFRDAGWTVTKLVPRTPGGKPVYELKGRAEGNGFER